MKSSEVVVLKWLLESKGWYSPDQTKEDLISDFKSLTKDLKVVHSMKRKNKM